jgi:hypothetical protein
MTVKSETIKSETVTMAVDGTELNTVATVDSVVVDTVVDSVNEIKEETS